MEAHNVVPVWPPQKVSLAHLQDVQTLNPSFIASVTLSSHEHITSPQGGWDQNVLE